MAGLRNFIFISFFSIICFAAGAQDFSGDLQLIRKKVNREDSIQVVTSAKKALKPGRTINYINPFYWVLRGAMFTYQGLVSPQISANCTFVLTCSNYSKQAIADGGLFLGVLMSADRLMRCNHGSVQESPSFYLNEEGDLIDEPIFYLKKY